MALNNFERLSRSVFSQSSFYRTLEDRPETCSLLTRVLGSSQHLADILVRDPEYFYWLVETPYRLLRGKTPAEFRGDIEAGVSAVEADRITVSASRVMDDADIDVRVRRMVEGTDDAETHRDHEEFFSALRVSRRRMTLSWIV